MLRITKRKGWRLWLTAMMALFFALNLAAQVTVEIGTGTATNTYPFNSLWHDCRTQVIYEASDIIAAGGMDGLITEIGFNVTTASSQPLNGFNIDMQLTTASSVTGFVETGWTNVYSGVYTVPGTNWQMIALDNPFLWDGTSNLLVQVCFDNTSWSSATSIYTTPNSGKTWNRSADNAAGCSLTGGSAFPNRPNVRLTIAPPPVVAIDVQVGNGTTAASYPFYTSYEDSRTQLLYPASELQIAGAVPGDIISIGFNISAASGQLMEGFNIDMQNYAGTSLTGFVETGWTNVYSGTYTVPAAGVQMIDLQVPFAWDGVSGLLINVCYDNIAWGTNSPVLGISLPGLVAHQHMDGDNGCTLATAGTGNNLRANLYMTIEPSGVLPTGIVQGFVTNGFGIPVAGATVAATGPGGNYVTTSGANGAYQFDNVGMGYYTIGAALAGYNTAVVENLFVAPGVITYQNLVLHRPSMAVTPNPYSVTVHPNQLLEGALTITNNGDGVLDWEAELVYVTDGASQPVAPAAPGENQSRSAATVAQNAADVSNMANAASFRQTTVPMGSSRAILFNNGPLVNSPGTGAGGADESILQTGLGMGTYGSNISNASGYSIADDFEVTGNWNIESAEFFAYQTGSSTTSTFTAAYCRVYNGAPNAGGTVIWGDLTTNRMTSTSWTNIYRNDDGPGGSTNRPVMKIVAATPGLTLSPGTYWIEWTLEGTVASGPWAPAVTIPNQTTTGNAIQWTGSAWQAVTDVGPQGMPFILNGTGGGGGGASGWLTLGEYDGTVEPYHNFANPAYFNATGAEAGDVYQAEVTFTSDPNVGTVVVPVTMIVAGEPLSVPTDLTALLTNPVTGQVNLSWSFDPGDGFVNFVVKRNGVQVGNTAANIYTDMLPGFGTYFYTVQAVYSEGLSAPAGPVEVEWANPTLVLNPTSLYNEQYPETFENVTLRLENTGEGVLTYNFPDYVTDGGSRAPLAYCTSTSSTCDEYIGRVQFVTIDNSSACTNYADYTAISTDVTQGETYPITITNPSPWSSDICGVYIDWNQNESFDDAGEYYALTSVGGGASFTGNIAVPDNALAGPTRMRVRLQYSGTMSPCGNFTYGEVEDYTVNVKMSSFIVAVTPAQGQVAAGSFVDVAVKFSSFDWPLGLHNSSLALETNDLAHASVTIPAAMLVYNPGMISGTVTSAVDGSPIFAADVTAGAYSTSTDADGHYHFVVDAGTYNMTFSKLGYTTESVAGVVVTETNTTVVDAELEEGFYPPTLVHAVVNEADTQTEITWGLPQPDYEIVYDDGSAENYAAWALPGNMNAVKFTPAGYPATVTGGRIYVGDGSFPNNNTGFLGTTFGVVVYAADGANGMPGTTLDSISVDVTNYGWIEFGGLEATVTSGNFYLAMVQGAQSPNCAPVGIDQTIPTLYRSYSRNVSGGGAWTVSPFQDMMIRAYVSGPVQTDGTLAASSETKSPAKQRLLISQSAPIAVSGVEGQGQYLALQGAERGVTSYKIWRVAGFDPEVGPQTGAQTLLSGNVAATNYTDVAYGPLPEGWYAYAVATNYTNGGESEKVFSNIVGHKKLVTVTCNVSLTTGGSPAGAVVRLTGHDYPFEVYTATVPEDGTVVFENVWKGHYTLFAGKVGFDDYVITPNITTNRTFDILLLERKYKPRNLYVDDLTLVATWDEPLAVAVLEDFEGGVFPPAGWQTSTQNTTGWYATTNGSSTNWTVPPHTRYAVTNDDTDNGNGCCDYLITPEMDWTDLPSYRLNFASFFDGAYSQSAYVEISTDNGTTWTVIHTMAPAPGAWQDIEIDLAQFSGANGLGSVWVNFHADDNGEWATGWAIDDVSIASGGVAFDGYGVFLDGTLVDNTPEETYTYTNLNYGQQYLAGVAALFSSGYSELDTYLFRSRFLFPPDSLQGESPLMTDYVHLTWFPPTSPTGLGDNQERMAPTTTQPQADVVEVLTPRFFPQTNVPLASSRNILFDNGPLVNSPGTGSGGADESILQTGLGMTSYGSNFSNDAGFSVADDFEVTGNWNIQNIEFFGYQTGSTTTSSFTAVYCRVYDGAPNAGGTVIWGDMTTNRMISTEWSNIYRNDDGPGGSTNRPIMKIVAETPGLTLSPGTYWVEWGTSGSLSSGPWVPAVTIQGETTTGNAIQWTGSAWQAVTDVGPQGMPFILNGTGGGAGGGAVPSNLLGYNIYRDDALAAYVEHPQLEYFDLNLDPGTYTYEITAVYDLTPYGYAGQTGESMVEGPIEVSVIYGDELPFFEDFTTGLFTTNRWTVDGANWRIAGQAGNPAPSAEFFFNPKQTDYALSLTSYWLNGTGFVDGSIYLDFDIKLKDQNATGKEALAVEVFNGSAWSTVETFTAEGDMNWESKHIDITGRAKNKVFRVRFTAKGENTYDIYNWLIDNVHIYRECAAPTDLTAEVNFPYLTQVILNWEAPSGGGTGPGISGWLKWDNGVNDDAIGLNGGGTFNVAVRFTPTQLAQYAGTSLTKIRLFPYSDGGTLKLKVWTGANASTLVLTQPLASYAGGQWNEFNLTTPIPVTGATELWFGYEVTHPDGVYVAGCDAGPAVAGFGDMISLDGSSWESMATAYGLNYNWNLQGFVETLDGVNVVLQPLNDETVYGPVTELVRGNLPALPGAALPLEVTDNSRELTGYNVYRDGALIGSTAETTYIDADQALAIGNEYCYTVTAVYEDCESPVSNEVCVVLTDVPVVESGLSIYPNPSNSVVNIELTSNISQVAVYNYLGQVVYENNITGAQTLQLNVRNYEAGAYLVKFVTREGETLTRKIVVTR